MLIHWPHGYEEGGEPFPKRPDSDKMKYSDVDYLTTWKVLEDFVKEGKVELHPYFQQKKLREFCKEKHIAVTAYSSLSNPGSAFFRKAGDPNLLTEPVIKKIASAHNKTPAQVALRWAVQLDVLVIPKSTSEARIKENAALFDFKLTDAEMKEIEGLDRGWRIVNLTARDGDHLHFPFLEEF
ncbi:oxidoreductase, aldo/keto reductase family protein [Teladorsagia circumcincta]|uniref:Oxidoreductase, aldo/keto reductase family protein n=1 Tax=Teladorsagia circumcincta TaxID=45464 RepID=A0A2G9UFA2_TELCI|nr:oxidoreductase, aldo/keto reductase family protein [Teladorsagia circumcincta]